MTESYFEQVRQFHIAADQPIEDKPKWVADQYELRYALHKEEYKELCDAMDKMDIIETADAIADLIYVLCGTALTFGIPLDDVFTEVQRANMSKVVDGRFLRRKDGKILKGPDYRPPDIKSILFPVVPVVNIITVDDIGEQYIIK